MGRFYSKAVEPKSKPLRSKHNMFLCNSGHIIGPIHRPSVIFTAYPVKGQGRAGQCVK